VDYELRGPLAGLRNVFSFRRKQESVMAESLRALRKLVDSSGVKLLPDAHARFALQAGPSAESRASRVVPLVGQNNPGTADGTLKAVSVGDDDIPEMPAAQAATGMPLPTTAPLASSNAETGGFVSAFANDPGETAHSPAVVDEDTKPRPPHGLKEGIAAQAAPESTKSEEQDDNSSGLTVPISLVAPPRKDEPQPDTQTMEIVTPPATPAPNPQPDTLPERIPTGPMPAVQNPEAGQNGSSDKRGTQDVSIWDVFGVERPSDRAQAELSAVIASIQHRASESPTGPEAQSTEPVQSMTPSTQKDSTTQGKSADRKAAPPVRPIRRGKPHYKVDVPVRPARRR
jgi:hypothetical protein